MIDKKALKKLREFVAELAECLKTIKRRVENALKIMACGYDTITIAMQDKKLLLDADGFRIIHGEREGGERCIYPTIEAKINGEWRLVGNVFSITYKASVGDVPYLEFMVYANERNYFN